MADPEDVANIKKGAAAWNRYKQKERANRTDLIGGSLYRRHVVDLSGADLISTDLSGTDLTLGNLSEAKLINANLSNADLREAILIRADLSKASLSRADLSWPNLSEAKLIGAELAEARLRGAVLDGADLTNSRFSMTLIADTDLRSVRGLETAIHTAPSTVGIDTIYRSHGQIPEIFLRGTGVPEPFITNMNALVAAMEPIQFYSCFIAYSTKDENFAERLNADLRAKKLRCWFAPEDLKIGDRFEERLEESIRLYDKVMIILSEASVQSRWVEREVNAAREREDREKRTLLFPIRIDEAVMNTTQPWAADIRRGRHIGDFRGWKHQDAYKKAFERLLRDLQEEVGKEATAP